MTAACSIQELTVLFQAIVDISNLHSTPFLPDDSFTGSGLTDSGRLDCGTETGGSAARPGHPSANGQCSRNAWQLVTHEVGNLRRCTPMLPTEEQR